MISEIVKASAGLAGADRKVLAGALGISTQAMSNKYTRDSFDVVNKRITDDSFALYKNQRDSFDALSARIGALETKQAVADAVEPWRAKVLDMRINLEAERRCCADSKIVNYANSTFVPQMIVDFTTGTTTHAEDTYNPLCSCCGQKG